MSRLRASAVNALRWLFGRPALLPFTATVLRARTVRPTAAFVARECMGRGGLFVYRVRYNGLRAAIRHNTGDVVTLGEVFYTNYYQPIREVEHALARVENIVDLGANVGLFGVFAATRWPEAEILAFEPDPANAAVHERTIALNELEERWKLIRAAAGAREDRVAFVAGGIALSHLPDVGEDEPTIEVPLEDVLPRLAGADLLKMDIEGGEWAILGDPRFRAAPPRALVLEYHPHLCPGPNARGAAESALEAAGLCVQSLWHRDDGHGMLWAWRD
ncbi:MAG: FkbM family methyltransferase [Solirubrobacterales bacterium]